MDVYYKEYLGLEGLLNSQKERSKRHDETLFIIVHQAFELWFKQILHEFDSIIDIFSQDSFKEKDLGLCLSRLERVTKIQGLFLPHLEILETMSPMDFLEFRDEIRPASGFQSIQFREIELKMGLPKEVSTVSDRTYFLEKMIKKEDLDYLEGIEQEKSLFDLLENWLERIPFMLNERFSFWDQYKKSVEIMLASEELRIQNNPLLREFESKMQMESLEGTRETFDCLFSSEKYSSLGRRLSQKATLSALFILLYRNEPILHIPYKFLSTLMDLEENFTAWRYRHVLLAQRMLGTKIGTGGSSGAAYLKKSADNKKIFEDILNLSTYIIPESKRPLIPAEVRKDLGFYFEEH
ncbi:MAG: tryptophan 2,3-dioxygenase [Epsilonproteobacteria bacterium]|nr:MAG: tryptophan 2,3-dioxygenase [Campylobacterota bacterium]RLA65499.1 MAG: tryptophan 2,3-dioxygenase [Campylobacterota bacterium]